LPPGADIAFGVEVVDDRLAGRAEWFGRLDEGPLMEQDCGQRRAAGRGVGHGVERLVALAAVRSGRAELAGTGGEELFVREIRAHSRHGICLAPKRYIRLLAGGGKCKSGGNSTCPRIRGHGTLGKGWR